MAADNMMDSDTKPPVVVPLATAPVTITIEKEWLDRYGRRPMGHEYHFAIRVLTEMRAKGVPMLGVLTVMGCSSGRLTMSTDFFDNIVVEWAP